MKTIETIFKKFDSEIPNKDIINSELLCGFNDELLPDIYKFTNICIGHKPSNKIYVPGNSFLIFINPQYTHLILDSLSSFLYIKKHIPDIKLYAITTSPGSSDRDFFNFVDLDMFRLFDQNFEESKIKVLEGQYEFENVYDFELKVRRDPVSARFDFPFTEIRQLFTSMARENNKLVGKYYISRIGGLKTGRVIEDEIKFEKYFSSLGYNILNLEKMTLQNQIDTFYNATEIVSISGSGLTNTVVCKEGTKILEINTKPEEYSYKTWARISKVCKLDYLQVGLMTENNTSEELIDKLKSIQHYL
jgi:hypothetical protein